MHSVYHLAPPLGYSNSARRGERHTLTASEEPLGEPRQGAGIYLAALLLAQVCALTRYVLLARLLGPHQLGLAATLVLTAQFFDSFTDAGSDRFLIQDEEGDTPKVQKMVQSVFIVRGIATAAALALFSAPIAHFFKTPSLAPAIMVLALYPLTCGFFHLDNRRRQRAHDFRPEGITILFSEAASIIVTAIVAWVTRSYTAVLWAMMTRAIVIVLVSHLLSKRKYELGYAPDVAGRLARFAAPLMVNGLILFFGGQGDRLIVVNQLGLAELGRYSAVILLIFYPATVFMQYGSALYLPRIADSRGNVEQRRRLADTMAGQTLFAAVGMSAGFALVTPTAVLLLYGPKFAQSAFIVAMIGVLQTSRFIRVWPTTIALGLGKSGIVLSNNVARLVGFPVALGAVALGGGLKGLVGGFIFGEIIALATAVVMVNLAAGENMLRDLERIAAFLLGSGAVLAWVVAATHPSIAGLTAVTAGSLIWIWWVLGRESATIDAAIQWAAELRGRLFARQPS